MSARIDWHSPLRCPSCKADAGHPFSVQTKSVDEIIVNVRCGSCRFEWRLERASPTLAARFDPIASVDDTLPE